MKHIAIAAAISAAVLVVPGTAHADDASYQQYLISHGYGGSIGPAVGPGGPMVPLPGGMFVDWGRTYSDGHMLCDRLHSGASRADLAREYSWSPYFPLIIDAAQHELCPDTLGKSP